MSIRLLVCGGRHFADAVLLAEWLGGLHSNPGISVLINGGAPGADTLACQFCEAREIPVETYPALWEVYGASAGPRRNQRMIDEGKPDLVLAFPGGRGTADMVRRAKAAGIAVQVVGLK